MGAYGLYMDPKQLSRMDFKGETQINCCASTDGNGAMRDWAEFLTCMVERPAFGDLVERYVDSS